MTRKSGTLSYAEQLAKREAAKASQIMIQYMTDTLQITIHQTEGWGYDRIMRLCGAWSKIQKEYCLAIDDKDPSSDVYREHMDRVMLEIIGKKQDLIPFDSRYPELKKVKYGK